MIAFIDNKPILKVGNQNIHNYDLDWLERAIDQALEENNADNPMLSETICEAFDEYLTDDLSDISINIEALYEKLSYMLESIGLEYLIESIEIHTPGVTLDLLTYVEQHPEGFELGFIVNLSQDIQALQPFKHRRIDITNQKEAIQNLTGAKRWSPTCQNLSDQVDRWVNIIR